MSKDTQTALIKKSDFSDEVIDTIELKGNTAKAEKLEGSSAESNQHRFNQTVIKILDAMDKEGSHKELIKELREVAGE